MSRLPSINSDADQWGDILNDYLSQSLAPDGTIKDIEQPLNFADNTGQRRACFVSVSGDLWFLVNAYWDPVNKNFYRIDTTHASFGYQLQAVGLIPGEPNLGYYVAGATMWVAQPEPYTVIAAGGNPAVGIFGFVGGWELGYTLTQERQMTIGGGGIEIDGYGTLPYGRVLNNVSGSAQAKRLVGMCQNIYTGMDGYDDPTQESWYWGYIQSYNPNAPGPPYPQVAGTSHWAVAWIPPNTDPTAGVWNELITVKPDGEVLVPQNPTAPLGVATKQYVDAAASGVAAAHGGEVFFTGTGSQTVFNVAHTLGHIPSRVHVTPMNQASLSCWATADATNVGVNYATAPANGAALALSWTAFP